jgi:hypothetical protein
MFEPAYLGVSLLFSGVGFVMFMYGRKQGRPVQIGAGLLLLVFPFFVHDALWLGLASAVICVAAWGAIKAGL